MNEPIRIPMAFPPPTSAPLQINDLSRDDVIVVEERKAVTPTTGKNVEFYTYCSPE